ncbi:hypothetical protein Tco_1069912 [Tanacetum coccineum]|uniref:Uncharacterized protein n=1 Tax=Tanacetum coccineum TaxID=301880 RepID=A0ABQ5HK93_9ASTR
MNSGLLGIVKWASGHFREILNILNASETHRNDRSRLDLPAPSSLLWLSLILVKIMAAPAITISSDSSDESVGSPPSRVILFGDIPTVIPSNSVVALETSIIAPVISSAAPMVETTLVASPTGLCGLVPYTGSDSDSPDEMDLMLLPWSLEEQQVHSLGLDALDQAHSGSSTRDVSPRLCYPPTRAPRRSEAFRRWCAAPLSTLYPPTTSESSSGDSSERPMHLSSHSAGPSHKRYSYSSEASIEEDVEVGPTETGVDMELGIGDGDDVGDHVGIDPMTAPIVEEEIVEPAGEDSSDSSGTRDGIVRSVEDMPVDLDDAVRDFYHHMFEVRVDRIVEIETAQRRLEADQLIASGDRARMAEIIYSLRLENLKFCAMLDIERDRVRC